MQRVVLPSGRAAFAIALSEGEVRRLCGAAAFTRGDAWQRAGHVTDNTAGTSRLAARVRGTWRRSDTVVATIEGSQIKTRCSCAGGAVLGTILVWPCRHAAALLLHWLRQPTSFVAVVDELPAGHRTQGDAQRAPGSRDTWEDSDALEEHPEGTRTETDGFAGLLERWTSNDLRALARRRNLRITAHNKRELVEQLSIGLLQPESIVAALASLDADARLMLYITDLIGAAQLADGASLRAAFHALGGSEETPVWLRALTTLHELALVLSVDARAAGHPQGLGSYIVPEQVWLRLPPWPDLMTPGPRGTPAPGHPLGVSPARAKDELDIHQVLLIVTQAVLRGEVGKEVRAIERDQLAHILPGWRIDPRDAKHQSMLYSQREIRLASLPPLLRDNDRTRLAQLTGQPLHLIDFAIWLLFRLRVVQLSGLTMKVDEDGARGLLALPRRSRLILLVRTWLEGGDAVDLSNLTGEGCRLELHFNPALSAWGATQPHGNAVRGLVTRIVMRLDHQRGDDWYDLPSMLDLLWKLCRTSLQRGTSPGTRAVWWFTDTAHANERLDLEKRADWDVVWGLLVKYLLAGPLAWLGLIQVSSGPEGPRAFSLRPSAGILSAQPDSESTEDRLVPLTIELENGEPTVALPPGFSDERVLQMLARYGDVMDITDRGLRYRLPRARIQSAFDDGITGPDLIRILTGDSHILPEGAPPGTRAVLDDWWAHFGTIRLYDDVALVELGDDVLLRELLATSSLDRMLVHTFSPRIIAVDSSSVDDLIADLTRLGYTPRVVETA